MMNKELPALCVIIVTYRRSAFMERCLLSLGGERDDLAQVIVVDASPDDDLARAQAAYEGVTYVHAPELAGYMTKSRNRGLLHVREADVISFLDDDVVVHQGWARAVRVAFGEEAIDALAGRTLNRIPGEEAPDEPIGTLQPNGRLTAGFGARVDGRVRVVHGIGANMSFAREALHRLGGFRDDYPGTALREDTDIFLRISRLGGLTMYDPNAVVDHLPAPHVHGARFDTRYKLYGRRNHMVLLSRHAGLRSTLLGRWVLGQVGDVTKVPGIRRKLERLGVTVIGIAWGALAATTHAGMGPTDPVRDGDEADQIRSALRDS